MLFLKAIYNFFTLSDRRVHLYMYDIGFIILCMYTAHSNTNHMFLIKSSGFIDTTYFPNTLKHIMYIK